MTLAAIALLTSLASIVIPIGKTKPVPPPTPEPTPTLVAASWFNYGEGRWGLLRDSDGRVLKDFVSLSDQRVTPDGGALFFASWNGEIGVIAPQEKVSLKRKLPTNFDLPPVIHGPDLYITGWDSRIYSLDRHTLKSRWISPKAPGSMIVEPAVWQDLIITPWGSHSLAGLAQKTGKVLWEIDVGGRVTKIARTKWEIFVTTRTPELVVVSPHSMEIVKRTGLPDPAKYRPVVNASFALVVTREGALMVFDPISLSLLWSIPKGIKIPPVYMGGLIWVDNHGLIGREPLSGGVQYRYRERAAILRRDILEDLAWSQDDLVPKDQQTRVLWPFPGTLGDIQELWGDPLYPYLTVTHSTGGFTIIDRFILDNFSKTLILRRLWNSPSDTLEINSRD